MKSLVQFLKESVEAFRVTDLEATYTVQPEEVILQAPDHFQESDIQQYIDDKWLSDLPTSEETREELFGANADNISDAHFEYDTFEHMDVEPRDYIEWDTEFDPKGGKEEQTLGYFRLKNVRYIVNFDQFDLVDVDEDNVDEKLIEFFKTTESNKTHEWAVEIIFDEKATKYKK